MESGTITTKDIFTDSREGDSLYQIHRLPPSHVTTHDAGKTIVLRQFTIDSINVDDKTLTFRLAKVGKRLYQADFKTAIKEGIRPDAHSAMMSYQSVLTASVSYLTSRLESLESEKVQIAKMIEKEEEKNESHA